MNIPFFKPFLDGNELAYVSEVVRNSAIDSDGQFTSRCAELLEKKFGIHKVLMTPSCSAALEIAALVCDLQPGDEVITPSFTFVSTANAVMRAGGKPVFVDIRPDTLNLDEELLEPAITPRTKAVFPVHYAGVACEMDRILEIAGQHNLLVVEDAAQALNSYYDGRPLGGIGQLGTFSFHATKNFVCGEGGALCINNPDLVDRCEVIREKGTNRSQFLRGLVDKYTWVDVGSSQIPSEISCALLLAQLEMLETITDHRRKRCESYHEQLLPLHEEGLIRLPSVPPHCRSNYHKFFFITPDAATRDELLGFLRGRGIGATFHFVPLHNSPMGRKLGYQTGALPVTEDLSLRLIRLPLFCELTPQQQRFVVDSIYEFFGRRRRATEEIPAGTSGRAPQ